MTERKPWDMSFPDWVEHQIRRGQADGAFDDLAGSGKPIEDLGTGDELAWLAKKLKEEGVESSVYLPPQLAIAREVEDVADRVGAMRSERLVRDYLDGLNQRISRLHANPPPGPAMRTKLVNVDAVLATWREWREQQLEAVEELPASVPPTSRRRWWRRR